MSGPLERALRAGSAIAAGITIAWEHLHTDPEPVAVVVTVLHACPHCGASLVTGPHIHGDAVIWPTEHDGSVPVTAHDGSDPIIVTGHSL